MCDWQLCMPPAPWAPPECALTANLCVAPCGIAICLVCIMDAAAEHACFHPLKDVAVVPYDMGTPSYVATSQSKTLDDLLAGKKKWVKGQE